MIIPPHTLRQPSWQRQLIALVLLLVAGTNGRLLAQDPEPFFEEVDRFLATYVEDGLVAYQQIRQDSAPFGRLWQQMAAMPWEQLEPNVQKAFLINAYNLLVIKQVVDRYPIQSPKDVRGFFSHTRFQVGEKRYTLDHLENAIMRPRFKDARLHFALVCGAMDCPPLLPEAYRPEQLEQQLKTQTQLALNDTAYVRLDRANQTVAVSQVFHWFRPDFLRQVPTEIAYLNRYRTDSIPGDYALKHYDYDWTLNQRITDTATALPPRLQKRRERQQTDSPAANLQVYTPSVLLKKDQIELKLFNNLYTQTAFFGPNNERQELDRRETFFTATFSLLYGASESGRVNAGFDVNLRSVRMDGSGGSPWLVFNREVSDSTRTALSSIGPKVRISPFRKLKQFTIQSAVWFPVASEPEGEPWLDWDRITWWNQFFYDHSLSGTKVQLFFEADLLFRFAKDFLKPHQLQTPVSVFASYFPTAKTSVYVMTQWAPTFEEKIDNFNENGQPTYAHLSGQWQYIQFFAQGGIGGKYQLTPSLEVELLYTNFFAGNNTGAGQTFNLGLRLLH